MLALSALSKAIRQNPAEETSLSCREDGWGMPHHYMLHEAHASGISSIVKRYSE